MRNYGFTIVAGAAGQTECFQFVENSTGLFTVTPPADVLGFMTIVTTANKRNVQCFSYSTVATAWVAQSIGASF